VSTLVMRAGSMLCTAILLGLSLALPPIGAAESADASTLQNKVIAGYQGWFDRGWRHWTTTGKPPADGGHRGRSGLSFDTWPALDEYTTLYPTDLKLPNGKVPGLWAGTDADTVMLHMKWAQDYGVDGVFLQRFVSELHDPKMLAERNTVLQNLRAACEKHNRTFNVMYDLSGSTGAKEKGLKEFIMADWQWIIKQGYTKSPSYQYHEGKPVLTVWGWGFSDREQTIPLALDIATSLQTTPGSPTTLMGGVPFYWRVGGHDTRPGWEKLYAALDILSPWAVGRYGTNAQYDKLFTGQVLGDLEQTKADKTHYAPVVWPGFSFGNGGDGTKFNQIQRNCGSFFTNMASKLANASLSTKPLFIYVAMFDEVNEGTAILKAATEKSQVPQLSNGLEFTYLGMDPCGEVQEDHYLKLAGQIYSASDPLPSPGSLNPAQLESTEASLDDWTIVGRGA